jgi:hypothetical protein
MSFPQNRLVQIIVSISVKVLSASVPGRAHTLAFVSHISLDIALNETAVVPLSCPSYPTSKSSPERRNAPCHEPCKLNIVPQANQRTLQKTSLLLQPQTQMVSSAGSAPAIVIYALVTLMTTAIVITVFAIWVRRRNAYLNSASCAAHDRRRHAAKIRAPEPVARTSSRHRHKSGHHHKTGFRTRHGHKASRHGYVRSTTHSRHPSTRQVQETISSGSYGVM